MKSPRWRWDWRTRMNIVWFGCDVVAALVAARRWGDARHYLGCTSRELARARRMALRSKEAA